MILLLFCAALFVSLGEGSNVIPTITYPPALLKAPLTLRDPIFAGTAVWISGKFSTGYKNDVKIYVIAGGNGEFNDQMQACVLEIRAYANEDRISYGSLKHWGGEWNYAADSKNSIGGRYDFVLEFKEKDIVVWVNFQVMAVYPYSATINYVTDITGIYIPQDDELMIEVATEISTNGYGSSPPYHATFDPPLSKETQCLNSYIHIHCPDVYTENNMHFYFSSNSQKQMMLEFSYSCQLQYFEMQSIVDGNPVGLEKKKWDDPQSKNGMMILFYINADIVKVVVNGEDFFEYKQRIDIEKYPLTNLEIGKDGDGEKFPVGVLMMIHQISRTDLNSNSSSVARNQKSD